MTVLFIGVHVKFCLSQKVMVKKGRILHIQLVTVKISSCSSRSSSLAASLRGWVSINWESFHQSHSSSPHQRLVSSATPWPITSHPLTCRLEGVPAGRGARLRAGLSGQRGQVGVGGEVRVRDVPGSCRVGHPRWPVAGLPDRRAYTNMEREEKDSEKNHKKKCSCTRNDNWDCTQQ